MPWRIQPLIYLQESMMALRMAFLCLILSAFSIHPSNAQEQVQPPTGTGVDYEGRLTATQDEFRALNGRVEQLEFSIRRIDQLLQRMQSDVDARIARLEASRLAAPAQPAPQATPQQPAQQPATEPANTEPVNGSLGAIKVQNGKIVGGVNKQQSPALPDKPEDYGLTIQEQYDRAFGFLRQADYDSAEKAFRDFIDKNPKDKLIDNAKYWLGETMYVRGRFNESAVEFAEAYQSNPKGTKAPDSLLKLALSLENLDKKPDACTTLNELRKSFPKASASVRGRADEARAKLKCQD